MDSVILENVGGLHSHSLAHILNVDNTDDAEELNIIKHSPYFDQENFIKISRGKNENFTVLSLNIQSINAKFDQLKILLHLIQENNCHISAICLQETWLRDDTNNALISLENYNFISQGKKCSSHGGLAIYLHEKYNFKTVPSPIISDILEGHFIEISEVDTNRPTHILLGNIYRPPRDVLLNYKSFTEELALTFQTFKDRNYDIIIGGDMNIDLLKIKEKDSVNEYFDMIVSSGFFPRITLPTRISNSSATLIDNFLCKITKHSSNSVAGILLTSLSDHFPYFISLAYSKSGKHTDKYIEVKQTSHVSINNFKSEIANSDIYSKMNKDIDSDPNINYDIIHNILKSATKQHLAPKIVKFNKRRHKRYCKINFLSR